MQVDPANKTPKPDWYKPDSISELEKILLPEWFNQSAAHRTPETYKDAREKLIQMSEKMSNRYVTVTLARRSIPGDIGSLTRLHSFLTAYSLINEDAQNDSAPTPSSLLQDTTAKAASTSSSPTPTVVRWSETMCNQLMHAVLDQTSRARQKRPKIASPPSSSSSSSVIIDWNQVADSLGLGCTAKECERQFLAMPIPRAAGAPLLQPTTERSITPDVTKETSADLNNLEQTKSKLAIKQEIFQEMIDKSDPDTVTAVVEAALRSCERKIESDRSTRADEIQSILSQSQDAAMVGLLASQAILETRSQEDAVSRILAEIVDVRMQKLENRLAMVDDIEGMLEAERVALELERRDLYTARCRHWFGGA